MTLQVSASRVCGFCGNENHKDCVVGVKYDDSRGRHLKFPGGIVWMCSCECNIGRRKCANCNNRNTDEVSAATWTCIDAEACQVAVETKRANNPLLVQLREIQETAMAKIEENKAQKATQEKAAKEPTFCLVTGEPTSGGLFKPGMDARYVSERIKSVVDANFTKKSEQDARTKMKKDGVSEKLVGKFDKSLRIAKEKVEKAEQAAKDKAEAKAEKAKAKAEAKAEAEKVAADA